jgi:hypothetical protein
MPCYLSYSIYGSDVKYKKLPDHATIADLILAGGV